MNKLDQIIANKRNELVTWKEQTSLSELRRRAVSRSVMPDFKMALCSRPVGLIAEVKRRSPSVGLIRDPFVASEIALAYEQGGAQALSVLMDQSFFGGGEDDFRAVRAAVELPLLYKEFVVDPWQVWHAATIGASAILLIVAGLTREDLEMLSAEAAAAGLAVLTEVHDEAEADVAVAIGADVIGINNRNLKTFVTSLETTDEVIRRIPDDRVVVSESGIRNADDVRHLKSLGVDAILVGEHLLRQGDLCEAVKSLMEPAWTSL